MRKKKEIIPIIGIIFSLRNLWKKKKWFKVAVFHYTGSPK